VPLTKYIDKLPIPHVLQPKKKERGVPLYEVRMKQVKQKLHSELPETTVWGYEGIYPGPTIEVKRGERIQVKWVNDLPPDHLLPVDKTVHGAQPPTPEVRTVVHLHGGHVRPENDGYPEAWFTEGFKQTGPFFVHKVYEYPNCQRATTLMYHDHALGITRLNVYAGLIGFYLIRDEREKKLHLPNGKYEIPLLIQDKSFNPDGSLFYPRQPNPPVQGADPSIVPEFFGDTNLVNGKVWPYLEVEPRKYRFRIANGANSRFYRLRLSSGQPFVQIGTDGGFLETPVTVNELLLSPAERADVIIDFSGHNGEKILLTNDAPTPFPNGNPPDPDTTGQIMQFRVKQNLSQKDKSSIPAHLSCIERLSETDASGTRDLTLIESRDPFGRPKLLLTSREWNDPITEAPLQGRTEIWRLINKTRDTHPIHLHLVHFQILDRQKFTETSTGEIIPIGSVMPPDPNEKGWKDTVRANPGEITRIITRFIPFSGLYVWHCHILEHEDYEMMRPYGVVESPLFNPCTDRDILCPDDRFRDCFDCQKDHDRVGLAKWTRTMIWKILIRKIIAKRGR
jgi:spore coat protein A